MCIYKVSPIVTIPKIHGCQICKYVVIFNVKYNLCEHCFNKVNWSTFSIEVHRCICSPVSMSTTI